MTGPTQCPPQPRPLPWWQRTAKGLLVFILFGLLLMPGALKHLPQLEPHQSDSISTFLSPEIIPTEFDLQEEADRIAREIDAMAKTTLADYNNLSIRADGGIPVPESPINSTSEIQRILAAAIDPSQLNPEFTSDPFSAAELYSELSLLKQDPLHDPLNARALLDRFEIAIDSSIPEQAHLMGDIFWDGWYRPHDFASAFKWYAQAYEHGSKRSTLRLIACHAFGIGTKRDLPLAETMRSNLEISRFPSSRVRRLDRILIAGRKTPPLYTSLPAHGQVPFAQVKPLYPFQLRRANIEGRAVVSFQVDAAGFTQNLEVKFFTHLEFAKAAVEAVTFWRVAARVSPETGLSPPIRVPIIFNITDE